MSKAPRFNINDLPARYRQQVERQLNDSAALPAANVKQDIGDGPKRQNAVKKIDTPAYLQSPVSIRVHSRRKRLADAGQLFDKWIIDAIVRARIIHDDDPKNVTSTNQTQELSENEETVIEIIQAGQSAKE